ncbi:MAG: hypothetical protein JXX28_20040 [Deltaproteobacteria bacterium]|nr:hypothetical protein [Deltaproteobacteria bacterium]
MSDLQTRAALRARRDIDNEDIDDIIGLAAELQEQQRRERDAQASLAEVEAVAAELDIEPAYVEQAIQALHRRRAQAARELERAARVASARTGALLRGLAWGGGLLFALAGGAGALAVQGASAAREARAELDAAEARLRAVLERQASLSAQLAALQGVDAAPLLAQADAVRGAETVDEALRDSAALSGAIAAELGRLPPAATEAEGQARLNQQYELSGAQNRITVEHRRYEERLARVSAVRSTPSARLARALGLAD